MTNGGSCSVGNPATPTTWRSSTTTEVPIMLPKNRIPTHPGEVLNEEFLKPVGVTQVVAAHLGVPVQRINELVRGKRGVTPETAWLLAGAFGTTAEFWLGLQTNHDLVRARPKRIIQPVDKAG